MLLVVVVVVVAGAVSVTGQVAGLWRFNTVDTGSMRPTLAAGDMAVLRSESAAGLRVGQVLAFHPPHEPEVTVLHRVLEIGTRSGREIIRTKGDANRVMDPWRLELHASGVWVMAYRVPVIGYVAVWAHSRLVLLVAYALILALVVSLGLRRIWRTPPPPGRGEPFSEYWWRQLDPASATAGASPQHWRHQVGPTGRPGTVVPPTSSGLVSPA